MNLLKQNPVKYGLIMSGITALCLLLMEVSGQNKTFDGKSIFQMIFMFIAPFIVWYFGIKAKKKLLKNKITFKEALLEGTKISFVYGATSPFIFLVYYLFVNPEIL